MFVQVAHGAELTQKKSRKEIIMDLRNIYGPTRPVINDPTEREKAILEDRPALFDITDRSLPTKSPSSTRELVQDYIVEKSEEKLDSLYNQDYLGKRAVRENDKRILKSAEKHKIDPNMIRAVMFAENARGHKGIANIMADKLKRSKTALPMNINKDKWSTLVKKQPNDLYNPDNNVEAATILLKRISNRLVNPNAKKVGTIWQGLGLSKTNKFGEYIESLYNQKPWLEIDD